MADVWLPKLCTDTACVIYWFDHWQTLAGAAIAIPFAAFAIIVPIWQETTRQNRRLAAIRASMPLALSVVTDYAARALRALAVVRTPDGVAPGQFHKPVIPTDLVGSLERTIEAIGNRRVVTRLSNMIGEMQVLDARLSGLETEDEAGPNLDVYLVQAATIYAQAESLFAFARRRSRSTKRRLQWADITRAFFLTQVYDATHQHVHRYVERLDARHRNPEDNDPRASPIMRFRVWWASRREQWARRGQAQIEAEPH